MKQQQNKLFARSSNLDGNQIWSTSRLVLRPRWSRNTIYHCGRIWNYEGCAAMSQDTHFISVDLIQGHETASSEEQLPRVFVLRLYRKSHESSFISIEPYP